MNQKWKDKILGHLQFARHWLAEAEADFTRNDNLRGELNLALVEAEVRHAWELSAGKVRWEKAKAKSRPVWFLAPLTGILAIMLFVGQLAPADMPQGEISAAASADKTQVAQVQTEPVQVSSGQQASPQNQPVAVEVPLAPKKQESFVEQREHTETKQDVVQSVQKQKSELLPEKAADTQPKTASQASEAVVEPKIEFDLRELTQLAQEVLYAKADS